MWTAPVVTVAASAEPLDTVSAVEHLRAQGAGADSEIARLVSAARAYVENYTGTRLITQTLALRSDDWADLENLPVAPVQSITSISYVDTDGATQTLAGSVYDARLYGLAPTIVLKFNQVWPTIQMGSLITVTAVVGYGAAADVPSDLIHALRLLLGDFYQFRETAQADQSGSSYPVAAPVSAILANYRKYA
jgi:uncharacterized phiE125 gp8 family phage protein